MVVPQPELGGEESNRVTMSPEGIVIHMRIPAEMSYLGNAMLTLREICDHLELGPDTCFQVLLSLDEAVRNSIEYAYLDESGWVDLQFTVEGSELEVVVEDFGCGIVSEKQSGVISDAEILCDKGRGLAIIRGMPGRTTVLTKKGCGTRLAMMFYLESMGD